MNENKKFNVIIAGALLVVGVMIILCGAFPEIIDILLGVACLIAAIGVAIKAIITKKKVLQLPILLSAVLVAGAIVFFIGKNNVGGLIIELFDWILLIVGAILLADTIYNFFKRKNTAANVAESILAVAVLGVGIAAVVLEYGNVNNNSQGLVFYFSGAVIILASIIIFAASLINFNKYLNAKPVEEQKPQPKQVSHKSKKNKKRK
jgi:hypothetical protein